MSLKWDNVKPSCCAKWLVLPTVYSEALSYGEQLDKFCYQLNQLIDNNNVLPDFIAEMIKEYINSGAIGEVVRDVLANYILNVKYPPNGITPAVGDGSADDTAAIQGCIDWAAEHGGGAVYVPNGKYLTQPLKMRNNVSIFSFDRYSCVLALKGGADKAMLWCDADGVNSVSICNVTLDGNMGIQVNDVNVIDLTLSNCFFQNLVLTDGNKLMRLNGKGGHVQVDNIVFEYSVINSMELLSSNSDTVYQVNNVVFENVSELKGEQAINVMCDYVTIENAHIRASVPVGLQISSNNCRFVGAIENAVTDVRNTGNNNTIIVNGKSISEYVTGDKMFTGRNHSEVLSGDKDVYGVNYTETLSGNKRVEANSVTEITTDKRTIGAKAIEETITEGKTVNAQSVVETISDSKTVNAQSTTEVITGSKTVNAGNLSETVTGDKNVSAKNHNFNGTGFNINTTDPIGYMIPQIINKYFSFIPFKNGETIYKVLVKNGDLSDIGGLYKNVTDFGLVSDGITDNSESFNNAISNNKYLYFPAGEYMFNEIVRMTGVSVLLHPDAVVKCSNPWQLTDCYICGGQFQSTGTTFSCYSGRNHITRVSVSVLSKMQIGIVAYDGVVEIDNSHFNGNSVAQFAIWSDPNPNKTILYVHNCTFEFFWLNAIFSSAVSCIISANYFRKCHIQAEPNGGGFIDIVGKNTQGMTVIMGNTIVEAGSSVCSGIESEYSANVVVIGNNIDITDGLYCIACQTSTMYIEHNKFVGNTAIWTNNSGNISTKNNWYSTTKNIVVGNPYMSGVFIESKYTAPLLVRDADYMSVMTVIGHSPYLDSVTLDATEHLRYTFNCDVTLRIVVDDTTVYEVMVIKDTNAVIPIVGTIDDFALNVSNGIIDLTNYNNIHKFTVYRIS